MRAQDGEIQRLQSALLVATNTRELLAASNPQQQQQQQLSAPSHATDALPSASPQRVSQSSPLPSVDSSGSLSGAASASERQRLMQALEVCVPLLVFCASELQGQALREAESRVQLLEDQCSFLKGEVRRLERSTTREGVQLEYLKNVIVEFLTGKAPLVCLHVQLAAVSDWLTRADRA
jgi:hypothetical protein